MRKLFYLAFCAVLLAGVGCAITDYQVITDNDQLFGQTAPAATINTNGKANIRSFQITLIYAGLGRTDEAINFVDQKSNGDRTLNTYDNHSTFGLGGPTFKDDLYCNPDWTGCATWTAHDPPGGYDRKGAGFPVFDGNLNNHCKAYYALAILASTKRQRRGYYNDGECGRGGATDLASRLAIMNMGQLGTFEGEPGLWYHLDQNNTTYTVNNTLIPLAQTSIFLNPKLRIGALLMDNPLHAVSMNAVAGVAAPGEVATFSLTYNGYTLTKQMVPVRSFAARANERY
jgi:hypothetical protein